MNTERFIYCDSNEDGFLDMIEFEDYLFPHKSFKKFLMPENSSPQILQKPIFTANYHRKRDMIFKLVSVHHFESSIRIKETAGRLHKISSRSVRKASKYHLVLFSVLLAYKSDCKTILKVQKTWTRTRS